MSTIAENIRTIRETMAEAARQAGRDPSEIRLCAATKMNDAAAVRAAIEAGVDCCGENRVQEIQEKRPQGAYEGKPLHFIGHLQTNKVKYIADKVDMIQSLLHSCDVYYYVLGEKLGIDRIESFAKACGFGAPTGIDLPHEKSGLVPSRAWKKRRSGEAWYRGETLNVSIGQGYTLVTPLQMANFVSSLLNGGKLMKPQLLVDAKPEVRGNIPFSEEARKLVLEGMRVTADVGTAKVLRRTDAVIGGKTGTAQVVKIRMVGERRQRTAEMAYLERDHAWIASYGRKDGKDVVVVVMLEHGGGGSSAAGPVARDVYNILYGTPLGPQPQRAVTARCARIDFGMKRGRALFVENALPRTSSRKNFNVIESLFAGWGCETTSSAKVLSR